MADIPSTDIPSPDFERASQAPLLVERLSDEKLPLVNRFYRDCRYSAKAGRGDWVYVLRLNNRIVAAVKLVPQIRQAQQWLFLRSMCVAPEQRRKNLGSKLLFELQGDLDGQLSYCYPFAHLQSFYEQIGFCCKGEGADLPNELFQGQARLNQQGRNVLLMVRRT